MLALQDGDLLSGNGNVPASCSNSVEDADLSNLSLSDADTACLIRLAADFPERVYRRSSIAVDSQSYEANHVCSTEPSRNGTVKAMEIHRVRLLDRGLKRKTVLVIAVRGSASFVDWVVNLNGEKIDVSDTIVS